MNIAILIVSINKLAHIEFQKQDCNTKCKYAVGNAKFVMIRVFHKLA
jgi:hypothetical protein